MADFFRRWLYIGPCRNKSCGRMMWGEEGVRVTAGDNGKNRYYHCCSLVCAQALARRLSAPTHAQVKSCANLECEGLVIGTGVRGLVAIGKGGIGQYGSFCCPKCARKQRAWIRKKQPRLLLALEMRESMMSPAK